MKPWDVVETGQSDMFRSRLDQIIDMGHEKVMLAQQIDWQFLSEKCGGNYREVARENRTAGISGVSA